MTRDEKWALHAHVDADFAVEQATQRSTSGVLRLYIEAVTSHFPLHGVSKRPSSAPEAELVRGHFVCRKILLPAIDLREALFPSVGKGVFHEDNVAMIQVIKTGRNAYNVFTGFALPHCTKDWVGTTLSPY